MEPWRRSVERPKPFLGAPRTFVILLWLFVGICLQVVGWKVAIGVIAFGVIVHGLLVWLQRKHPFASDVFIRLLRGGNKGMIP